ncbi:response regulator [Archangium violaceum]|nr:response regulator [Archangium violaceum]
MGHHGGPCLFNPCRHGDRWSLPVARWTDSGNEANSRESREGAPVTHTVLLVEDSNTIRHILKIYLMKLKLDFLDADRAERGLELLQTHPVHLVIADVNMPGGMDGLEFVRRVRASAREPMRQLPIVLLTGGKAPDLEARGLQAGASEFVRKPVSIDALASVVRRQLGLPAGVELVA